VDDAVKLHVKYWNLFVHFPLYSTHKT